MNVSNSALVCTVIRTTDYTQQTYSFCSSSYSTVHGSAEIAKNQTYLVEVAAGYIPGQYVVVLQSGSSASMGRISVQGKTMAWSGDIDPSSNECTS